MIAAGNEPNPAKASPTALVRPARADLLVGDARFTRGLNARRLPAAAPNEDVIMANNGTYSHYELEIVRHCDGVGFGRRPVPESCLEPAREQLIFFAQRQGRLGADATGARVADSPLLDDAQVGTIKGVQMQLEEGGKRLSLNFGLGLFQSFSEKLAQGLLDSKQLQGSDEVRVRAFAREKIAAGRPGANGATVTREPLPLVEGHLDRFLSRATAVGPMSEGDWPVFVTESVLQETHELVWERNRERGAWLIGNLYRNAAHGGPAEIFGAIHTAVEARGATHEQMRLDFSTDTYTHLQRQLQLRRERLGKSAEVPMGLIHSHPFLPSVLDGKEACPTCSLRTTCSLTSSFFSKRDQSFHAAVFGSAPYAVEFVLGLTPREEFDLRMFCYDGGQVRQRGYYRLAEMPDHVLQEGEHQA